MILTIQKGLEWGTITKEMELGNDLIDHCTCHVFRIVILWSITKLLYAVNSIKDISLIQTYSYQYEGTGELTILGIYGCILTGWRLSGHGDLP